VAAKSDVAGEEIMIFRCLVVPLTMVAAAFHGGQAFAQNTLPAPPAAQADRDACMKEFVPLRREAEQRGKLIRDASQRHATPDETCELIGNFGQSEIRMIQYVEANSARCEIAPEVAGQLKAGHQRTEAMQKKICVVADLTSPELSLSDVLGRPPQRRGKSGPIGDFDQVR
jgi:hypothetical protein